MRAHRASTRAFSHHQILRAYFCTLETFRPLPACPFGLFCVSGARFFIHLPAPPAPFFPLLMIPRPYLPLPVYLVLSVSRASGVGARQERRGHGTHSKRAMRPRSSTLGASTSSAPTSV